MLPSVVRLRVPAESIAEGDVIHDDVLREDRVVRKLSLVPGEPNAVRWHFEGGGVLKVPDVHTLVTLVRTMVGLELIQTTWAQVDIGAHVADEGDTRDLRRVLNIVPGVATGEAYVSFESGGRRRSMDDEVYLLSPEVDSKNTSPLDVGAFLVVAQELAAHERLHQARRAVSPAGASEVLSLQVIAAKWEELKAIMNRAGFE